MTSTTTVEAGCYPIGTVSALTGINSVTLRAWERRYHILEPRRSDSGHRLYSEDDIERIRRVQSLLAEGVPISQVGNRLGSNQDRGENGVVWQDYIERMVAAVQAFDEAGLEAIYNEVLGLYPMDKVNKHLLLPLLRCLGDRWQTGDVSVAEEHFFSLYLRNKIGAQFHHRPRHAQGPVLLAACLPGEHHELGLLLFSLFANERDFQVILLGADTPLNELPEVVHRAGVDAVVLSGICSPLPGLLEHDLRRLAQKVAIPVFVGGHVAVKHSHLIQDAGAIPVGDDLALSVGRMAEHPSLVAGL